MTAHAPASLLAYGRAHHCDCGAALSVADPVGGPCLACAADPRRGRALSRGAYLCAAGCGRVVIAYKSKCSNCRRLYYAEKGK